MLTDPSPFAARSGRPAEAGVAVAAESEPNPSLWRWYVLLAAPFVACGVFLAWTGRTFEVFWGSDEMQFHYPLMRRFARELPHIDWRYSGTATTPLFHLLGAGFIRLFGEHLQVQRLLNAAVSLAGVLALFTTLRGARHHRAAFAALLTTVFLSSCYFFGYSFRLLTDNLALVGCILAVAQLYRFADATTDDPRLGRFLWGCFWLGLTILTRQSYVFLGLVFLVALLFSPLDAGRKLAGLAGLAIAAAPFAALVLTWHGLVPPGLQERHTSALFNLYAPALPLLLLGAYTPFFAGPRLYRLWAEGKMDRRRLALPAAAVAVGLAVVAWFPLYPLPAQRARITYISERAWHDVPGYFAGWMYKLAGRAPVLHGNSLVFWLLFPCGLAAAASAARTLCARDALPGTRLAPLFLLALLLSSLLNGVSSQKYYDGLILLFLIWSQPTTAAPTRAQKLLLVALILLFCAYYIVFLYGLA